MSLTAYREKRRFDRTPEPRGGRRSDRGPLRFVVQKHQASRLHYDLRLEMGGTLKSWAVPKGPSLNPEDKRLAVMVEDHPLDYRTFEGTIPEGNYGAGTVIVWDEGIYCARETADRAEGERLLREGLEKGRLSVVLSGQKLKGEFSLIRLKRSKGNDWLLIKKRDEWASDVEVTEEDRSVSSGRTLEQVSRGVTAGLGPRHPKGRPAGNSGTASAALRDAPKATAPRQVRPMLASLVEEPFDRPGWLFEPKWDGYRAIAEVGRHGVALYSRNHKSFEHRFALLVESLRGLGSEAVLDGEVVVVDEQGQSHFQQLQNYQKTGEGRLLYYVFDLLHLDGRDLRRLPLVRRKELLRQVLHDLPDVLLSEHVEEHGIAFFEAAAAQGLEGIVAKDGSSPYREGQRGHEWLKIKTCRRQEAVVCGFTEPRGSRKDLGALVLGVHDDGGHLVYIGHTAGRLSAGDLRSLRSRLEPLVRRACPFRRKPRTNAPAHWVAPELVCEVRFREWTQDGRMRQPIFLSLREDKMASEVRREEPEAARETPAEELKPEPRWERTGAPGLGRRRPRRQTGRGRAARGPEPALTNPGKLYWPKEGYTKGDLLAYYRDVAPVILPYLRDRPQSLHRHPDGITGKSFFQKDVSRQGPPGWVQTVTIPPESGEKDITYLLCQDEAALLYAANLGCIELNPWNLRVGSLDRPDYLVMDLDPEDAPFAKVVEAALAVRRTLERAGVDSVCKTSGKRGLHVFVPLGAGYDHEQARQFAQIIATLVHQQLPGSTSPLRSPARRQGRVYLDFLQNRRGQTVAAPYCVRPVPGATVSTPLRWAEVRRGLDPARFTVRTMGKRLEKVGDLWAPVLGPGVDLPSSLERLARSRG